MRGVVLLLAAGEGSRLDGGEAKAFVELCGVPIVRRSAEAAASAELVDGLVVAAPPGLEARMKTVLEGLGTAVTVVTGGDTRQASAASALAAVEGAEAVAVHDAARALCPPSLFDICLRELDECSGVCPALPVSDTIKEVAEDVVVATLDRRRLAAVQTPQAFRTDVYRFAHESADRDGVVATDDAALVERTGTPVLVIPGDPRNVKITTAHDLVIAEALLTS
jgi:2-C-methyl-D-erythritol 4-phosphate cytidylyltransferase